MKSIFLSPDQVFDRALAVFDKVGAAAPPSDMALMTCRDDGFLRDGANGINYYLAGDACVDRFGRSSNCAICAVRPAILLAQGDESRLKRIKTESGVTTAEFGTYPTTILDESLRDMARREYSAGTLFDTGRRILVAGSEHIVYQLGAKQIVCVTLHGSEDVGYVQLSDGTAVCDGDEVFLELRPVRWLYDKANSLIVSCTALFGGMSRDEAAEYLDNNFIPEITAKGKEAPVSGSFRFGEHDEMSLIQAYVDADIPVFIHGLSGDGKSDRVREIDPQVLDIELVNENPETINGRAIYNEAKDEIIDIKPVWLVKLERLCSDGKPHILFFDELTNATKQTQSVIFKIVLERFVNNRWALPENARIVAAGNDRSESSAAHDLAEPLFGRFAHIYIHTTIENWMPWAVKHNINPYVLEFLANNDLYLRTPFTGTDGYADPRRWEMVSKLLDSSGNDFSILAPILGHETADAFVKFFKAQQQLAALGEYTDEELSRFTVARRYQLAQQCLYLSEAKPDEARALVTRLGPEFLAWYDYVSARKKAMR